MTIFALAHIAAGTLAVLTGLIALFAQKGGKLHRRAGRVFVGTMILTAGGGALYAFGRPEALTAIIGFFYLLSRAQLTAYGLAPWPARAGS